MKYSLLFGLQYARSVSQILRQILRNCPISSIGVLLVKYCKLIGHQLGLGNLCYKNFLYNGIWPILVIKLG